MKKTLFILAWLNLQFIPSMILTAHANDQVIQELTRKINNESSEEEKSKLYLYRARNFSQNGNFIQAELDYDAALQYNHQGWIHLERGRFFIERGNLVQATREALAAEKETPTLKPQARKIISIARKLYKKEQAEVVGSKEILLTKKWKATKKQEYNRNLKGHNVRAAYAARNKMRSKNRPRARS